MVSLMCSVMEVGWGGGGGQYVVGTYYLQLADIPFILFFAGFRRKTVGRTLLFRLQLEESVPRTC